MVQNINDKERKTLDNLKAVLSLVRSADPDMATQTLHAFLKVAANPGISMPDLQREIGMSDAATSRIVSRLSEFERHGVPGLNWVQARENLLNRRMKNVELTAKGATVARKLSELVR